MRYTISQLSNSDDILIYAKTSVMRFQLYICGWKTARILSSDFINSSSASVDLSEGLRFRPAGLRFRPQGLRFRPESLRFRPGLRS